MFTLGNWIAFGVLMVIGVLITLIIGSECYGATGWIISGLVSIIVP